MAASTSRTILQSAMKPWLYLPVRHGMQISTQGDRGGEPQEERIQENRPVEVCGVLCQQQGARAISAGAVLDLLQSAGEALCVCLPSIQCTALHDLNDSQFSAKPCRALMQ